MRPKARAAIGYEVPASYAEVIEPRFAPIADRLVDAARPRAADDVLELGSGTGIVTRRMAGRVRSLLATDVTPGMLEVARGSIRRKGVIFAIVDYTTPLPFLDRSFDLVVSGLTYVQDKAASVKEVARVLRADGRLALTMWGPSYHELRLLSDAAESVGRPRLPRPAPARTVQLLKRAGFRSVRRDDFDISNEFASVDEYLGYRRAFGTPAGVTRSGYERYLRALHRRAAKDARGDGRLTLGWTLSLITAQRQ